jgi:thiol-disulfide isomerase/thioredoxin
MIRWVVLCVYFMLICQTMLSQSEENAKIAVVNFDQLSPYLHQDDDSVHLVNFWATWCIPCREEMPAIQKVEKKYADMKFKVLLVSLDFSSQLEKNVIPYLKSNNIRSEVVLLRDPDQNRWIDLVDKSWAGDIPFTLIYGKNFRQGYARQFNFEDLDSIIHDKLYLK